MNDVEDERQCVQRVAEDDVVEALRVALEHVAVPLVLRERVHQRHKDRRAPDERLNRRRELEVVEVAQNDDLGIRIDGEDRVGEVVDDLGLLEALGLAGQRRRLEAAEEGLVAALGVEVVGHREEVVAVEGELANERLAARVEGGVGRIDPARAEGQLRLAAVVDDGRRRGRGSAGTVDECQAAVRSEQESDADVAAGLAAVSVVDRVDLAELVGRAAFRLDRGDELVQRLGRIHDPIVRRPVVVLDLLEREQVRRAHVVDDEGRELLELRIGIARIEVLDVERADRDHVRVRVDRGDFAGEAVAGAGGRRRLQELEVAEVVVEDADDRRGVFVADVQDRHRGDRVIDLDPLRVEVAGSDDDAAAVGANARVRPVVRKNPALAIPIRGADDDCVVDLEPHPFERLVEVDAVLRRVEDPARLDGPGRVVLDDCRRRGPPADADDGRRGQDVARWTGR